MRERFPWLEILRIRALPGSINFNFFVQRGLKISYDQFYFFYIFYLRQRIGMKQYPGDIDRIWIRLQGKIGIRSDPHEKSGSKITKKHGSDPITPDT